MTENATPSPAELAIMKAHVWRNWEQLPPEHQAAMTMLMVQTLIHSGHDGLMVDAWRLLFGQHQDETDT